MAFADWVKRSDLAATALSRHQNMREVLQAAYKAGERQGRSDAEALEQNAVALDTAHDIMSECYGTLGALVQERDRLLRGEYICKRCGLRKDSERVDEVLFYAE